MTAPADAIPDLERLMRDVLRRVFDATLGADWLKDGLSNHARQGVGRAAETARKQRPNETLRDDWDAVGIGEIAATLRSCWQKLSGALADVWMSMEEAVCPGSLPTEARTSTRWDLRKVRSRTKR